MFKLASLLLAASATVVTVQAGIDIFLTSSCALKENAGVECWDACKPQGWYQDGCDPAPLSTMPEMDPNWLIGGTYPDHMFHPGLCGSNPLDFYNTSDGYDVYYSGGDGTLLGHCSWYDQSYSCNGGTKANRKLYSCDIPVC